LDTFPHYPYPGSSSLVGNFSDNSLTGFFSNYPTQKIIDDIFNHIKKYNLRPPIAKIFSLEDIGSAHLLMEQNKANGKVVVLVD
jgi:NADPH:quinone reductase-like Zn-dependent oxidoreductase